LVGEQLRVGVLLGGQDELDASLGVEKLILDHGGGGSDDYACAPGLEDLVAGAWCARRGDGLGPEPSGAAIRNPAASGRSGRLASEWSTVVAGSVSTSMGIAVDEPRARPPPVPSRTAVHAHPAVATRA